MIVSCAIAWQLLILTVNSAFVVSLGSILARETVTATIAFVMDLMDDELKDEVRLQLPLSIGSRYGPAPDTLATASTPLSQTSLCITVNLQMSGTIRQVTSPMHPTIVLAPKTSRRRQTFTLRSQSVLYKITQNDAPKENIHNRHLSAPTPPTQLPPTHVALKS